MEKTWVSAAYFMLLGYIGGTAVATLIRRFIADAAAEGAREARLHSVPPAKVS